MRLSVSAETETWRTHVFPATVSYNSVCGYSGFREVTVTKTETETPFFNLHCIATETLDRTKIEADDSNCTVIYCIFISGLVSFPLWVQKKKKKENWPQIFIFHFSEKLKFDTGFLFSFFYVQKKIKI